MELEFVELEEDYSTTSSPFFPRLEKLILEDLPVVKRWRKKKTPTTPLTFPLLSYLEIRNCELLELASFPHCPQLQKIDFEDVDNSDNVDVMLFCPSVSPPPLEDIRIFYCKWLFSLQGEATASLRSLEISGCNGLKSLQLASPHLQRVHISKCEGLVSLEAPVATPSLTSLSIEDCGELENLSFGAPLDALEELEIRGCRKLDYQKLELATTNSLFRLRELGLLPMPPAKNVSLGPLYHPCTWRHFLQTKEGKIGHDGLG